MHKIDEELFLSLEGNHEKAWQISEELEKLGPDKIPDTRGELGNPDIWMRHCFNRGWHVLQRGDFQTGMQLLENGRFLRTYGNGPLKTDKPIWNPKENDPNGKGLIISLEGGFGDEIIYARFVPYFKKLGFSKVYLAAAPELVTVFSRIEGCDGVILRDAAHTVNHDYWIPGFSSGWLSGTTFETLSGKPYLTADTTFVEKWKERLNTNKKLKVGIRWAGNPQFEHQQFRTFPVEFLFQMQQAFPDVQFYSFQRDWNTSEKLPYGIIDLQEELLSWEDTAAAITQMDLMISSCTSVAHMSAALGKDTFVIIPILPYHVWSYGCGNNPGDTGTPTSPWYDSVTLFRQIYKNKWNHPFQDLYNAFKNKLKLTQQSELKDCDPEMKKLNMGCGFLKLDGYVNADISSLSNPDIIADFSKEHWDQFQDNEFTHIVAKDILEHIKGDFCNVIKEMYRISKNGAVWEIQFPHHRCDTAVDDPTHVRLLTQNTFKLFDRIVLQKIFKGGRAESMLAFEHGVDIEVCDVKYDFVQYWSEKLERKEITKEQLYEMLNFNNNVAESVKLLIQVHKPVRIDKLE